MGRRIDTTHSSVLCNKVWVKVLSIPTSPCFNAGAFGPRVLCNHASLALTGINRCGTILSLAQRRFAVLASLISLHEFSVFDVDNGICLVVYNGIYLIFGKSPDSYSF